MNNQVLLKDFLKFIIFVKNFRTYSRSHSMMNLEDVSATISEILNDDNEI